MDSDPPVIFKRTKSRSSQKTRAKSPEATETVSTGVEDSPITLATKLKNRANKNRPKSRLSFGGDEEVWLSDSIEKQ
jgi:GC-rich sequence DNA-binding factor